MSRDEIYADTDGPDGPFEFSARVVDVFPDMLRRSIPGYAASLQAIRSLTGDFAMPETALFDLGCSLGASSRAMAQGVAVDGCRIVAVDNAPAMVRKCRSLLEADPIDVPIDVVCADVRETAIEEASVVVMNYTLQFLPPTDRDAVIASIAAGLRPGGVFVLSEKVVHADARLENTLQNLHLDFKRRHAYSELEIARKRVALENVLVPDTVEDHEARLLAAGFGSVGVWLRYFNFVSMIAIR
ncbi:MAG: carboxy-S-adenosyl-L-methionine synthase CmoA [Pseudomonadota bacterium]